MAVAGRILIMPKGAYDESKTYEMLDLVSHNGTSWLAKKTVVGIEPSDANSEYWHNMYNADIKAIQEALQEGIDTNGQAIKDLESKTMTNFGRKEGINIDALEMVSGKNQGRYFIETAKNPEGTHPEEGHYMLLNFPYLQIAVIGTATRMYIRMYTNDKWYPWTEFVRKEDNNKTIIVQTAGTDLDEYKEPGSYYFSSGTTPSNPPVGINGILVVFAVPNVDFAKQIWMRQGTINTNDHDTYIRSWNNGVWSNWKKVTMD